MRRSLTPWPAVADLFSGLLVATFGGLMLFTGSGPGPGPDPVDQRSAEIRTKVHALLKETLGGESREQGDEVFLDVALNFNLNRDTILRKDREKIARACSALHALFDNDKELRNQVEIWIEGHTDRTQPGHAPNRRERYLFNWRLSGNRAASVLHEFHACGLEPGRYRILAIGHADTRPKPGTTPDSPQHRRTTFRIRPDRCRIEIALNKRDASETCVAF